MKIACPYCQQKYTVDDSSLGQNANCQACNADFVITQGDIIEAPSTKKCPFCGEMIRSDAVKCKHCGEFLHAVSHNGMAVAVSNPELSDKSRFIYIILALFLGMLGVHNFYAGYIGRGFLQLLLLVCTFGFGIFILFVWIIIEICVVSYDGRGRKMR